MFAIAYYVTTSTCLFGANTLKRKACMNPATANAANEGGASNGTTSRKDGKSELKISAPANNFVPSSRTGGGSSTVTSGVKSSSKKQAGGRRNNDARKGPGSSGTPN
mmetsp:Transcript_28947/g.35836  ORF Transcript_28947/g.35836 Transcript_28947/m.35836 type:complete len:107 (+) Transcript_28947:1187-1507(+)